MSRPRADIERNSCAFASRKRSYAADPPARASETLGWVSFGGAIGGAAFAAFAGRFGFGFGFDFGGIRGAPE
jgi:hypothetical protein